jgi:cytochrome b pre-mRNA-processing protein 3
MFTRLLAKSPGRLAGERLHAAASAQARSEALYAVMGAPDTVEGRFELLTLHVILLVDRLKGQSGVAAQVRQTLFDAYISNLDGALREMGVGDLAVGKRMRKLGEAFYGRAQAYDDAFAALPDPSQLEALLRRTVFAGSTDADAADLTAYATDCRQGLAAQDVAALLSGFPQWSLG